MEVLEARDQLENKATMQIFTLGQFTIKIGETLISENARRSNKLWELFKYLLTNRNKRIPLEKIVQSLWPEQENSDPKSALLLSYYCILEEYILK
jgi:two-component SAPR family response regulator